MAAQIVVIEGSSVGTEFPLEDRIICEVGSSDDADLTLPDEDIVPVHLKIYRENADYHIFDLSGRGFLINGNRSLKHALKAGDVVALGSHALRFEVTADEDDDAPLKTRIDAGESDGDSSDDDSSPQFASKADVAARSTGAELQAIKGNDTGKVFALGDRPMSILGRGIATDITVWDIRVSRVHCRIDGRGGEYTVSDMNSSNGTYVNGVRLKKPEKLKPGDFIKLGSTVLQFDKV